LSADGGCDLLEAVSAPRMTSPAPIPARPRRRMRSVAGFTILELGIVTVILGLISGVAMPAYQRIQRNSRFGVLNNDFRVFASAFQQYNTVNATWPAYNAAVGTFPAGMDQYLRKSNWGTPTVFRGYYNWDYNITHNGVKVKAAIAIYSTAQSTFVMTQAEMQQFDNRYDDGNLKTGNFQMGFQNSPVYVIEK
jgi:type II secretory pathway pseudopilin PulG